MEKKTLDVRGTKCPVPIVRAKQAIDTMSPGDILEVLATDAGSMPDFVGWAQTSKLASSGSSERRSTPWGARSSARAGAQALKSEW